MASRLGGPPDRWFRKGIWFLVFVAAALASFLLLGVGQDAANRWAGILGALRVALPVFFLIVAVLGLFHHGAVRAYGRLVAPVAKAHVENSPGGEGGSVDIDLRGVNYGLLRRMEWRRYEIVCAEYLRCLGSEVMETGYGRRQGFDLEIGLPGERQPSHLAKCHCAAHPVDAAALEPLYTAMRVRRVAEGMAFSVCGFTRRAERFAAARRIALVPGEAMCGQIARFDEETRAAMLKVATSGNYTTPMCPVCGIRLVLRRKRRTVPGRGEFWGCINYPRCRITLPFA